MLQFSPSIARIQWPVIHIVATSLMAVSLPLGVAPAQANSYQSCSNRLLDAGLNAETAALACAQALHPDDLSRCVVDITSETTLAPDSVLSACGRDRRPQEVASCVNNLHNALGGGDTSLVLQNCRLSILPLKYSECVSGLSEAVELASEQVLNTCIAAGYQPRDVAPTFIYGSTP